MLSFFIWGRMQVERKTLFRTAEDMERAKLSDIEEKLVGVHFEDRPEKIVKHDPGLYEVMNPKGKKRRYFALSLGRALALAYYDFGYEKPLTGKKIS